MAVRAITDNIEVSHLRSLRPPCRARGWLAAGVEARSALCVSSPSSPGTAGLSASARATHVPWQGSGLCGFAYQLGRSHPGFLFGDCVRQNEPSNL